MSEHVNQTPPPPAERHRQVRGRRFLIQPAGALILCCVLLRLRLDELQGFSDFA